MKKAFTLAEVLITLGIIGVVAALTMPSLINNSQEKANVTKLTKDYALLSQAITSATTANGMISDWGFKDGSSQSVLKVYNYIKPYLNVLQYCGLDYAGDSGQAAGYGCFDPNWVALNGSAALPWSRRVFGMGSNVVNFILVDGTIISIDGHTNSQTYFGVQNQIFGSYFPIFMVDVNGKKKPNKVGRDIFFFILTNTGLVPAGVDSNDDCKTSGLGLTCAQKVLTEKAINYSN